MADEQSPDSASPDSTKGPGGSGNEEQDLDAVLAEAASLSADLSAGLGETKNQTTESPVEPTPKQTEDVAGDLDAELKEMEQLLQTASADLGTESSKQEKRQEGKEQKKAEEEPGERAQSAAPTQDIPDFMEEFTRPEPAEQPDTPSPDQLDKPPPAQLHRPSPDQTSPRPGSPSTVGVVGTGKVGVIGLAGPAGSQTEPTPQDPDPTPPAEEFAETPVESKRNPLRSVAGRLSPVVLPLCEQGTRLLEILDKPTVGVSEGTRRILGWVALASLGTAGFVFVISLF